MRMHASLSVSLLLQHSVAETSSQGGAINHY